MDQHKTAESSHCPKRAGFTLIETLIVVGITAVLASIMLTYSSTSRNQIRLYTEEVKIAETITRAKSLTVTTFNEPEVPCGYGAHFNYAGQSYEVFSYNADECLEIRKSDLEDRDPAGTISSDSLPREIVMRDKESDSIEYIFFEPPNPDTTIWQTGNTASSTQGKIYLRTIDGSAELEIFVNDAGQISF